MRNADALELVRINDTRRIILLTEEAQRLIPVAQKLINQTPYAPEGNKFDLVTRVATEMGLLVA
jgi:hypothetical protein